MGNLAAKLQKNLEKAQCNAIFSLNSCIFPPFLLLCTRVDGYLAATTCHFSLSLCHEANVCRVSMLIFCKKNGMFAQRKACNVQKYKMLHV